MAENDPDDQSIISMSPTDWVALNAPVPAEVKFARKLVAIENLTVKDTIVSTVTLPFFFSVDFLPEGLEPGTRQVELLDQFYNSYTVCSEPGCYEVLSCYPLRLLHLIHVHGCEATFACATRTCFTLFKDFESARAHFAEYHMDRVRPSAQPNEEENDGDAA